MYIAILLIISYLLGAVPNSLIIGKLFYKKDLRNYGSGNIGTTNTFRVLGKKPGVIVLLLDMLKGFIPVLFPLIFNIELNGLIFGVVAAIGHVYPIYLKFKGGKAVATSAGAILAFHPAIFIGLALFFLFTLKISKYVSLSSILSAIVLFICSIFTQDLIFITLSFIIMVIIIIRHRSNIKRLINGTESKAKI